MNITITDCRCAPRWGTLEKMIRESLNNDSVTITRIKRVDNGCNYRGPGDYELSAILENDDDDDYYNSGSETIPITLVVRGNE